MKEEWKKKNLRENRVEKDYFFYLKMTNWYQHLIFCRHFVKVDGSQSHSHRCFVNNDGRVKKKNEKCVWDEINTLTFICSAPIWTTYYTTFKVERKQF